jgi:hypothetical protein
LLVRAGDIAHPGRDREGQAADRVVTPQPVADRAEQTLRQLLRAVHRDLRGAMGERRVGETLEQVRPIGVEIGAHMERRRHLGHQAPCERGELGRLHDLEHVGVAGQVT